MKLHKFKYLRQTLHTAEITAGCALLSPCMLASVQLLRVIRRFTELSVWMGCTQCNPDLFQGLCAPVCSQ